MNLELRGLPASNDRLVVSINPEISSIDIIDEVPETMLDGHKLSDIGAISLLFLTQRLGPESKRFPDTINQLIQAGSQADFGGVSGECYGG